MYNPSHNNFWNACWLLAFFLFNVGVQWQIQGRAPLIFTPNWGLKGRKKNFLGGTAPPPLSQDLDLALGVDKVMRSKQTCQTNIEGKSGEIYVCVAVNFLLQ